jgi:tetratricopeptide (TPR) repeat protein
MFGKEFKMRSYFIRPGPAKFVSLALIFLIALFSYSCRGNGNKVFRSNNDAIVVVASFDEDGRLLGQASGFIVTPDGKVVTNYHVVSMAYTIKIRHEGTTRNVTGLTHVDSDNDIAILRLEKGKYKTVRIGDPRALKVGEKVYAIGSPQGLENTMSEGIISGIRKAGDNTSLIQITAPISRGSSGGPVFNVRGEVVGITTFLIAETQNLNFALPVDLISRGLKKNGIVEPKEACRVDFNQTASCYFYQGVAYGVNGKQDRAVDAFKRSLKVDPNRAETYINLGVSYALLEKYGEAEKMFDRALALEPENPDALAKLGATYTELGRFEEATKILNRSLAARPDHVDSYFFLALNYEAQNKLDEAVPILLAIIKLQPQYADAYAHLGTIYTGMGKLNEAIAVFKTGISQKPEDPMLHLGLGKAYALSGDRAAALEEYKILKSGNVEMAKELFAVVYK